MIRLLKVILILCVAFQGLFYAIQNIVNLDAAYGAFAAIMTMADHAVYVHHFGPAVDSPALIWAALWLVIAGESLVGVVSLKGAYDLYSARTVSSEQFNAAKTYAILGCGLALIVWFGFFLVFGGAYFQMWQTQLGIGSLSDATKFVVSSGIVMIFVNQPD